MACSREATLCSNLIHPSLPCTHTSAHPYLLQTCQEGGLNTLCVVCVWRRQVGQRRTYAWPLLVVQRMLIQLMQICICHTSTRLTCCATLSSVTVTLHTTYLFTHFQHAPVHTPTIHMHPCLETLRHRITAANHQHDESSYTTINYSPHWIVTRTCQ